MELRLKFDEFDEMIMRRYYDRGSPILFSIYWTHDQISFPSLNWMDFGVVILNWWMIAARKLLTGSEEEEFWFMDGPYSLTARREKEMLHISAITRHVSGSRISDQWTVPFKSFLAELVQGAEAVNTELLHLGIGEKEQEGLRRYADLLREYIR